MSRGLDLLILSIQLFITEDIFDINMLIYLKICCKGDAFKLIDSLEVVEQNCTKPLELLTKRYAK